MLHQLSPAEQPFMRSTSTAYGTSVSLPNRHRRLATSIPRMHYFKILILTLLPFVPLVPTTLPSVHAQTTHVNSNVDDPEAVISPEAVIRLLVEANANKDLATMKKYMGGATHGVGYTIGGRKFVGWEELASAMEMEFRTVEQLIIPITALQVWQRENIAWFAMELDYKRVTRSQTDTPLLLERDPVEGGFAYQGARLQPWAGAGLDVSLTPPAHSIVIQ